jgi:LmbE family N-acetylglucosaminyl deacetylase
MRALSLSGGGTPPLNRLLVVGCHADDIEIGCGGTVLALTRANPRMDVTWVVLAATGEREREARSSAEAFLADARTATVDVHGFRDGYLPHTAAAVKDAFEELQSRVYPDVVITHTRDDLHQDHRLACELTWNTFRNNLVLASEIPKWDGDLGRPNLYVPLSEDDVSAKLELLAEHFGTQRGKDWFSDDVFRGLMRIRGMECRAPSGYAEAFVARKLTLAFQTAEEST